MIGFVYIYLKVECECGICSLTSTSRTGLEFDLSKLGYASRGIRIMNDCIVMTGISHREVPSVRGLAENCKVEKEATDFFF